MAYIGQAPTKVHLTSADITDGTIALADMAANSIDSDQYVDGSIDNAHIADDAIDSEHYATGSIDTAHIATNQIDETLMKDAFVGDFSDVTVTAADAFLYGDATDSGNTKKDTVQGILDLAGGGAVTQAKFQYYSNQYAVTSSTSEIAVEWVSAGGSPVSSSYFDIIITPTSAAHDFWVSGYTNIYKANSTSVNGMTLHMQRDIGGGGFSTVAKVASGQMYYSTRTSTYDHAAWTFLDRTANTTSAITYRMYWYNFGSALSIQIGQGYAGIGVLELVDSIVS